MAKMSKHIQLYEGTAILLYATLNNSHWMNETVKRGEQQQPRERKKKKHWIAQTTLYEVELTNKFDIHDGTWAESKSRINARQIEHTQNSMSEIK